MAADVATGAHKGKLVIRNIGMVLSGDLSKPILDADAIIVIDGKIAAVGKFKDVDASAPDQVIDAHGVTVVPGLIDSHVHPVFGDWTPRQNQFGWIDSCLNGGVTTMVSAGEVHLPGRPKDIVGLKALAVVAQRCYHNFRPGGVKVLAGAPVIEKGMVESDFAEMAASGVKLLGEIGLGSVKAGDEARQMVSWARKHGIQSTIHTGGPSVPGSGYIDRDVILEADADVIGHINGGHTALPVSQICDLCARSTRAIEIVHNGNEKAGLAALRAARELGQMERVILGTDAPAGSGVQPLGMLRMVSFLSSLGDLPAEQAFCLATGNTARIRDLEAGLIEVGRPADLLFIDRAQHTSGATLLESVALGDLPGVGMVMIDGKIACGRSRNTPPAERIPELLGH